MQLFNLGSWTWLWETINGLFLTICNWVYILVAFLYKVFMAVARVNLFDKKTFSDLTSRLYIVIGIAMLFIFAYNLILLIINPDDKKSTGAMTKVVKETMISLTLVILLPTIFNWLYIFQNNILESNIIGKVILGGIGNDSANSSNCAEGDYDCSCKFDDFRGLDKYIFDVKNIDESRDVREELGNMCNENKKISTDSERGAKSIGSLLMSTFYKPTNFSFEDCVNYLQNKKEDLGSEEDTQICVNYFYDVTSSRYMGDTASFVMDPYLKNIVSDSEKNSMEFNFVMALVAGVLAIYMFFCYTMEIGVRVAKLGVLQLISPIPVMMRIIPKQKEGIYDKWFNHLKNTYLDVFIRLVIIYFALFAISLVPDVIDTLFNSAKDSSNSTFVSTLALVFVILGILKFAQEAPELIKDFFGSSGRFALKSPAKQLSDNKLAMAGLGMAGGAVSGYVKNFGKGSALAGGISAGFRGARAGYKSNSFSSLKSNVSGAVDRAVQARIDRDERQAFGRSEKTQNRIDKYSDEEKGFFSNVWGSVLNTAAGISGTAKYRANRFGENVSDWVSGESLAALRERHDVTEKAYNAHKKIVDDTKNTIKENPSKYSVDFDGSGNYTSLERLDLNRQKALRDVENYNQREEIRKILEENDRRRGEKGYVEKTIEQATKETTEILEELKDEYFKSNNLYENVLDNLTDAVIKQTEIHEKGLQKGEFEVRSEWKDVRGEILSDVHYKSDKEVTNLKQSINEATNILKTNSNKIGELTRNDTMINGSIKDKRNELSSLEATLRSDIAKKVESKRKDKK